MPKKKKNKEVKCRKPKLKIKDVQAIAPASILLHAEKMPFLKPRLTLMIQMLCYHRG